ncbi:ParB/RepB/Spo0J family partition protein [Streptomyces celluloflavus]|uniref:ParB/RepB/Spo0J family partition protein n=1 Tax=Streptomyces celluloflavus TaxID=58344 RepID=UPI00368A523B
MTTTKPTAAAKAVAPQWPTLTTAEIAAYPGNILPAPDADLTASLMADGITDPLHIVLTSTGEPQIIDGRRRAAAAIAAGITELPYSTRPMIRVSHLLAHPHNARTKAKATREMVESIKAEGVLIPVKISPTTRGMLLTDGHLRLDGARKAGRTHVPYEIDQRDEASQHLDMVATARHRQGLTLHEEAAALFRAHDHGAELGRVARAGGLTQKDARKAIKAGSSKTATRVAATYTLTLDQMATLAELAEQAPEAAQRIERAAAERREYIPHLIAREVKKQARAAKATAHRTKLEKAGASIRQMAELSPKAAPVAELTRGAKDHEKTCRGHVWVLEDGDDQYTPYCVNTVLYEHNAEGAEGDTTAAAVTAKAAQTAARRAVKAGNLDWDAATELRRQYLTQLIGARTIPQKTVDAMSRITAATLISGGMAAERLTAIGQPEILAQLLGVSADKIATREACQQLISKASAKRLPVISFAILAAGFETKMRREAWRTDEQRNNDIRRPAAQWLNWLTETLGYDAHPIETATRDDQAYTPGAPAEDDQPAADMHADGADEAGDNADTTAMIFHVIDRGYEPGSVETVTLMNNGGRSQLVAQPINGRVIPLAPTVHRRITGDLITAAQAHAKAAYGPRSAWPARITVTRPAAPADEAAPTTP